MDSKPGYKTTEFAMSAGVTVASLVVAFDPSAAPEQSVIGLIVAAVVSLGYTFARKGLKAALAEAEGDVQYVIHNHAETVAQDTAATASVA